MVEPARGAQGWFPAEILERWLATSTSGPALVLGGGELVPQIARAGFGPVGLVEISPDSVVKWPSRPSPCGGAIAGGGAEPPSDAWWQRRFALVVLTDAVCGLWPADGDRLLEQARRATRAGGLICAAVSTIDDPGYERLAAEGTRVARHTFALPDGDGVRRFFAVGELNMAFEDWSVLHAGPVADHPGRAVVVARRPPTGTDLA